MVPLSSRHARVSAWRAARVPARVARRSPLPRTAVPSAPVVQQIALQRQILAAQEALELLGALQPFGRDLQAQAIAQIDDGANDGARALLGIDALDQAAIELDARQRQLFQRRQRRITGAEIIERDRDASARRRCNCSMMAGPVCSTDSVSSISMQQRGRSCSVQQLAARDRRNDSPATVAAKR